MCYNEGNRGIMRLRITAQNRWTLTLLNNRPILRRKIKTTDFSHGCGILNAVAKIANEMDHHPDSVTIGFDYIEFILTTHSSGEVSEKDQKLAEEIDKIVS